MSVFAYMQACMHLQIYVHISNTAFKFVHKQTSHTAVSFSAGLKLEKFFLSSVCLSYF